MTLRRCSIQIDTWWENKLLQNYCQIMLRLSCTASQPPISVHKKSRWQIAVKKTPVQGVSSMKCGHRELMSQLTTPSSEVTQHKVPSQGWLPSHLLVLQSVKGVDDGLAKCVIVEEKRGNMAACYPPDFWAWPCLLELHYWMSGNITIIL
jgi:hypothetical protein